MGTQSEPTPCGECVSCKKNGVDGHDGQELAGGGAWSGTEHGCFTFSCLGHGECQTAMIDGPIDVTRLAAVLRSVGDGEESAIHDLFDMYRSKIRVNAARGAIQIVGCNESTIVAHIPTNSVGLILATRIAETGSSIALK